jgi:hypothetical protein
MARLIYCIEDSTSYLSYKSLILFLKEAAIVSANGADLLGILRDI